MQLAVIADIHANATALDAVLAEIEREQPNQIICLGDVAATGPQPVAAVERIQQLDCPVVVGNTDAWQLDPQLTDDADENVRRVEEIDRWCANQLSDNHLAYLESFNPVIETQLEEMGILCYHGSPQSYSDEIMATTPESDLNEYFADTEAELLVGGHTHVQLLRRYRDALILNPGSVGLPQEQDRAAETVYNPPYAEYAMVTHSTGSLQIELRRTAIDADAVVQTAEESGMPHADWWVAGWTAQSHG